MATISMVRRFFASLILVSMLHSIAWSDQTTAKNQTKMGSHDAKRRIAQRKRSPQNAPRIPAIPDEDASTTAPILIDELIVHPKTIRPGQFFRFIVTLTEESDKPVYFRYTLRRIHPNGQIENAIVKDYFAVQEAEIERSFTQQTRGLSKADFPSGKYLLTVVQEGGYVIKVATVNLTNSAAGETARPRQNGDKSRNITQDGTVEIRTAYTPISAVDPTPIIVPIPGSVAARVSVPVKSGKQFHYRIRTTDPNDVEDVSVLVKLISLADNRRAAWWIEQEPLETNGQRVTKYKRYATTDGLEDATGAKNLPPGKYKILVRCVADQDQNVDENPDNGMFISSTKELEVKP